ncbi:MAG TPA: hypothetical protein VIH70_02575, partial [Actinomycetota bacterium]
AQHPLQGGADMTRRPVGSDGVHRQGDALVAICEQDGVPYLRWETFDDVREALEEADTLLGPLGAERCPGWRTSSRTPST